jgi:putative tryptophan/tyrosine transport system substrate-binding protein
MTLRRRTFIAGLGAAAGSSVIWPRAARAQPALPVVGYLSSRAQDDSPQLLAAFRLGLKESGFVEGRNVAIDYRWAENQTDRLPALAADLVRQRVAVIAANDGPSAQAAKAATATIPIIFETAADPVEVGLVGRLDRPGGNLTGVTTLGAELGPKRLELIHEMVPAATVIALLMNPTIPNADNVSRDFQAAARTLGLQLHILHATSERDFDTVFATLVQLRVGALVIAPATLLTSRSEQLAALSVQHAVPTIGQYREFAASAGLMSYGSDLRDANRLVGVYAGRVLKDERPGDLPVQQAIKAELIINLKTAKALGLTVPLTLLGRADEVIE